MRRRTIIAIVIYAIIVSAAVAWIVITKPIPQDPSYHLFADRRPVFGIPNFLNVVSNIAFMVVGFIGIAGLYGKGSSYVFSEKREKTAYAALFTGLILTAIGSARYHLFLDDFGLFLDRVPMTIIFMSIFSILISEYIDTRWGAAILPWLFAAGAASVAYWYVGERIGNGDLRPYILVQGCPLISIPIILTFFKPKYHPSRMYLIAAGMSYGCAKVSEAFDRGFYETTEFISGHTMKHLLAAVSIYMFVRMLKRRTPELHFETCSNADKIASAPSKGGID